MAKLVLLFIYYLYYRMMACVCVCVHFSVMNKTKILRIIISEIILQHTKFETHLYLLIQFECYSQIVKNFMGKGNNVNEHHQHHITTTSIVFKYKLFSRTFRI